VVPGHTDDRLFRIAKTGISPPRWGRGAPAAQERLVLPPRDGRPRQVESADLDDMDRALVRTTGVRPHAESSSRHAHDIRHHGSLDRLEHRRSSGARRIPQGYSGSAGLLKSALSLMLPWPNWGKPAAARFPAFRLDAVSSGGKITSEFRNASTASRSGRERPSKASRAALASPPCRRMTSV